MWSFPILSRRVSPYSANVDHNTISLTKCSFIVKLTHRIEMRSTTKPGARKEHLDSEYFHKTFPYFIWLLRDVKLPSHGKLKLANSYWRTQVGVCERYKNKRQTRSICRQQFANVFPDCFCAVHTHQLEFANTSLPTLVCRVKAALRKLFQKTAVTLRNTSWKR